MFSVNGVEKQYGDLVDMIWNQVEIVLNFFYFYCLYFGDLIYMGMLVGVGVVVVGDELFGCIEGLGEIWLIVGFVE